LFHFKLPFDSRDWSHRAGRAGRWGREGMSFAVLEPKDTAVYKLITTKPGEAASEG
jgi:superfamily II DNA/RNA helicase